MNTRYTFFPFLTKQWSLELLYLTRCEDMNPRILQFQRGGHIPRYRGGLEKNVLVM